ncbi:phenylalanine--tRNA ligase subunit beta [Sphingomonas hankyongi]|uniref:Phenylalanine--tRNA ligase beta subunit n=1 Tax=Sphingomonas hankyongi TaxID=2908209 RepID=A0ABT0S4U7_9SPHN|nr:phenylalanine--tRNA ligase subunit beta [Sphingomonas hankyongi]MCL6730892.1 phenylalanine--tRNA ligase subunit beta [Sphingomonas hankyongi]
MKFTLSWLRDWLDTDADPQSIADKLTAIGLEVEGIHNPAEALAAFRVAKVLTAEKHPQADKLQVLTVDDGSGEAIQVVCGAPNARAGMLGVFGPPGAYIPGSDLTLKVAAIRGVESRGMMCSARELELGEDHDGIIELPDDAPVGTAYIDYAGLNDPVFDVNVTPNRPDCLGIDGIARDLAAAGIGRFRPRASAALPGGFEPDPKVIVESGSGCYVFWRRVIRDVRNGPSPDWLQQRLKAVGLRPISALVDITNFFSIDQARPLHVYDVKKLKGHITARRARAGERFMALNDKEYEATPDDCVIADESGAIGFGGVIGGESTGVDENTTDVLLECAWFDPAAIAATGRRHGIVTDARARFERGIDPMKLSSAIEDAAQMIVELCGGEASEPRISGEFPAEGYPNRDNVVPYRPARLAALAGIDLPVDEQRAILGRLEFLALDPKDGESWLNKGQQQELVEKYDPASYWFVRAPTWRPDVDGEADIVEEIARIHGFEDLPSTPLERGDGVARPTATRTQLMERRLRRTAAARGLDEAVTWSFVSEKEAAAFGGGDWRIANPISEDMKVMRPSLLPGLISAAQRNLNRGASSVRLFEIGRRYLGDSEHATLGLLLTGDRTSRDWQTGKAQDFDAYDAKAEVLALLDAAGAPTANLQVFPDAGPTWHPGRSATLRLGPKTIVASFGELHPRLVAEHDAPGGTVAAEIYTDAIPAQRSAGRARQAYSPPALQSVVRDFAFVVPSDVSADALVRAVRGADKASITSARVFDRYLPKDGDLSLAIEVTLQPGDKSFTEAEIADISRRIVAAAEKLGAQLRS